VGAWKKLLNRFAGAAVKEFGVLGRAGMSRITKPRYEGEYEGTFVDAVEHMEIERHRLEIL